MLDQLIAVFVAVVAEPAIRAIKAKFAPPSAVMLLITVAVAGVGATGVVLYTEGMEGFTLKSFIKIVPTIFAVGQVSYALL